MNKEEKGEKTRTKDLCIKEHNEKVEFGMSHTQGERNTPKIIQGERCHLHHRCTHGFFHPRHLPHHGHTAASNIYILATGA